MTLKEKTTFQVPYYLMKLISDDNLQEKVVRISNDTTLIDSSLNLDRYNQFEIEEVAEVDEDLGNGKINLSAGMTYDYQVYQTLATTGTTIGSWDIIVETGTIKVNGDSSTITTTYNNSNTITTYGE
ncbi:MAG: hypothetical protein GY870_06605 [archaeon]|nr:hypothetical protein [archaeon]